MADDAQALLDADKVTGDAPEALAISPVDVDAESVRLLDYQFCLDHDVIVLGRVDMESREPARVGLLALGDGAILRIIEAKLDRPVEPVLVDPTELRDALDAAFQDFALVEDRRNLILGPVGRVSRDPATPIPQLLDEILGRAIELRASDIHIETYRNDMDVRFRVDGLLHQVATPLTRQTVKALLSRAKVLAELDIAEHRSSQDGRIFSIFRGPDGSRSVNFRLSTMPSPVGEDLVMRVLDSSMAFQGLDKLGFEPEILAPFIDLIHSPEGLLLVAGPSGSGKTTTLYAALQEVKSTRKKVLTAEEPIEFSLDMINQFQVNAHSSFADHARSFMRQNADAILIGEIRDKETAALTLRAAQTGHAVYSTLHANDSIRTISRLRALGIQAGVLADSLLGALSQRLLRKLCATCREPAQPTDAERRRLRLEGWDNEFFTATGCHDCHDTGYKGRTGVFELFAMDDQTMMMIAEDEPVHAIWSHCVKEGMITLRDEALTRARRGDTSLEEIVRAIPARHLS